MQNPNDGHFHTNWDVNNGGFPKNDQPTFNPTGQTYSNQYQNSSHTFYSTDQFTPTFNPYDGSSSLAHLEYTNQTVYTQPGFNNPCDMYYTPQQSMQHNVHPSKYSQHTSLVQTQHTTQNPFFVETNYTQPMQTSTVYNNNQNHVQQTPQQTYYSQNTSGQPLNQYNTHSNQFHTPQTSYNTQHGNDQQRLHPQNMYNAPQNQYNTTQNKLNIQHTSYNTQYGNDPQHNFNPQNQYNTQNPYGNDVQEKPSSSKSPQNPFEIIYGEQSNKPLNYDIDLLKPTQENEPLKTQQPQQQVVRDKHRSMTIQPTSDYDNVVNSLKGVKLNTEAPRRQSVSETNPFRRTPESNSQSTPITSQSKPKRSTSVSVSTVPTTNVNRKKTKEPLYLIRSPWRDYRHSLSPTNKPLYVFTTPTHIVLNLKERPGEVALSIERKKGHPGSMNELPLTNFADQRVLKRYNAYGVLGTIALQNQDTGDIESFLILVVGVELVGRITEVPMYKITQVHFVSFSPANEINYGDAKKTPYDELKRFCENGSFYFSLDYDLTHSQQRIHTKREQLKGLQTCKAADRRFFWNRYLARYFIRKQLDDYLVIVIRGIVSVSERQYVHKNKQVDIYLISRIGCLRAGTRYNARGVNDNGDVGNFVETEKIVVSNRCITSFVQVRGSVPVFWEEPLIKNAYVPRLSRSNEASAVAFQKHFHYLSYHYGKVLIANLLSPKKRESVISDAYYEQYSRWDSTLKKDVQYEYFDFHTECAGAKFENSSRFLYQINDTLKEHGFFVFNLGTMTIEKEQKGIVRTNCLDCLDRTNVIQTTIAKSIMIKQMHAAVPGCGNVPFGTNVGNILNTMWADNGDALSKAYTGTGAMKSSYTRKGKSTLAGLLDDGMKSVTRFYINRFKDTDNQVAIDLFLGRIEEYIEEDVSVEDGWVRTQMLKREKEFTKYFDKNMFIGTFNCNALMPTSFEDLEAWINPGDGDFNSINLWVFGFQEVVELKPSQVWNADTTNSRAWEQIIAAYINSKRKSKVVLVKSMQLVGILLLIFISEEDLHNVQNIVTNETKIGFSGVAGNKGSVSVSLNYYDTSMCFVCCHMSADQKYFYQRVSDYKTISQTRFGLSNKYSKGINDHDYIFWFGDMNWRIDLTYEQVLQLVKESRYSILYKYDQLMRAQKDKLAFFSFTEPTINFPPTYKFDNGSCMYDSSTKRRIPAWTDRILYKTPSNQNIKCKLYTHAPMYISDHTPVRGLFQMSIKETDHDTAKTIETDLYIKAKEYDVLTLEQQQDVAESLI